MLAIIAVIKIMILMNDHQVLAVWRKGSRLNFFADIMTPDSKKIMMIMMMTIIMLIILSLLIIVMITGEEWNKS